MQVLVDNFHAIMYDGKERFDPIIYDNGLHFTHSMMCNAGGSFWEMYTNQLKITLILYKKWILPVEETTSGGRCGFFLAAFSRPASACPSDRVSQGVFSIF